MWRKQNSINIVAVLFELLYALYKWMHCLQMLFRDEWVSELKPRLLAPEFVEKHISTL